jgi:hypothetical protein
MEMEIGYKMIDIKLLIGLKKRYLNVFPEKEVGEKTIKYIEDELSIVLSDDFRFISTFFNGDQVIAYQSLFSFNPEVEDWNIIEKTKFYRGSDCELPSCYVVLREESNSFIVMKTQKNSTDPSPVFWLSLSDAYTLKDSENFNDSPIVFTDFASFFEFLLNEEENKRNVTS